MILKELFETLNWATRDNAECPFKFDIDDYVLLNVNIEDVFKHGSSDMVLDLNSPTGGKNAIGDRLQNAKQHFENNGAMDPAEVAYCDTNKTINFANGRHRAVAAYQLGYQYIPMFVYKRTIDKFKELVRTK